MSNESGAEIDPRFDPAFQRGFDPGTPVEEYVAAPLPRKLTPPPAPEARARDSFAVTQKATASLIPDGSTTARPPGFVAPATTESALALTDADVNAERKNADHAISDEIGESDSGTGRNPFLLFIGIIAVALIAAGIWLFVSSGDAFNSKEVRSQGDYMSLTATIQMAPFLSLLGGATAIGLLFVFAVRWRRRR
jgi:uncharacterized membrane protein YidH (DUF202 family)